MSTLTQRLARVPVGGLVAVIVLTSAALYLGVALALAGSPGFPLDDSWIHQTLARSLVREGRLAINPGEATAASTSPLWTFVLTGGHLLGLAPFWWSHLLGALLLGATAFTTAALARRLFPGQADLAVPLALLTVLEWRLTWAAFSGMETLLFTILCLALLLQATETRRSGWLLGLTGGLATLARPDGAVLFGLVLGVRTLSSIAPRGVEPGEGVFAGRGGRLTRALGGALLALAVFILALSPSGAYNMATWGSPLPATFQAKGAFYQQALTVPFVLSYIGRSVTFFGSGPLLLLAPGAVVAIAGLLRQTRPGLERLILLLPALWVLALVLLYLLWLPALYHHGRYLMPALPVGLVYGVAGTAQLLRQSPFRLLTRLSPSGIAVFTLALWVNGAVVYGWDVRYLTDQQVAVARWLQRETPADLVVATHDIGAIGYFAQRRVVDMAGLITPELTRTPRDQERILATLQQQGVTQAAIFPSWYPWLPQDPRMQEVYRAATDYALRLGGDEMRVYTMHW